jgi:hypothetical protein
MFSRPRGTKFVILVLTCSLAPEVLFVDLNAYLVGWSRILIV